MPNDTALPVLFPTGRALDREKAIAREDRMSRTGRFLIYIGAAKAMPKPNDPHAWGWNPSVITLLIVVGTLLFTSGVAIGVLTNKVQNLESNQQHVEAVATDATKQATYAVTKVDGGDGHAPKANATVTPQDTKK